MTDVDRREDAVWSRAFPSSMREVVAEVVADLPQRFHPTTGWTIDSTRHPRGIRVAGEPIEIPSRQYLHEILPGSANADSGVRAQILGCVYSRHHDGRVRQAWVRSLLTSPSAASAPFVVQMAGEYVAEIVEDIAEYLGRQGGDWDHVMATFVHENPAFVALVDDG